MQYTAEQRAQIGRYAARHGNAAAVRHFTQILGRDIAESSVRGMRDKFLSKFAFKEHFLLYTEIFRVVLEMLNLG